MSVIVHTGYRLMGKAMACAVLAGVLLGSHCWAADPQAEHAWEDRAAIEHVWAKYAQALDTADADLYASLFTPDAYVEVDGKPYKGSEAIKGLIDGIRQKLQIDKLPADAHGRRFGPIRHLLSNLVVDLQGDRATSESYWTEIISSGKNAQGIGNPPAVLKMGRYEDELVKKNGKWLFSRRIISGDLQMPRPQL
jgi:ketosteroid isomerase-like protein